jgi:hypothetical protein
MPPVPEIQAPNVEPERLPAPAVPAPSLGAFSGAAVGEGIKDIAHVATGVAVDRYMNASKDLARAGEIHYLNYVMQKADEYKTLPPEKALASHDKYTADINAKMQEISDSMPGFASRSAFENGAMRNLRIAQELINGQFEHHTRALHDKSITEKFKASAFAIGKLPPDSAAEMFKDLKKEAMDEAAYQGKSGEAAEAYAAIKLQGPAHAIVKVHPELLDQYDSYLTPSQVDGAQRELAKRHVASTVHAIVDAQPRIDAMGRENLESPTHDSSAVLRSLANYMSGPEGSKDEHIGEIEKQVRARIQVEKSFREEQGHSLLRDITSAAAKTAIAKGRSGFDFSGITGDERAALQAADPKAYKALTAMERAEESFLHKHTREAYAEITRQNLLQLHNDLSDMALNDSEKFKSLTPAKISVMMRDEATYKGGFPLASSLRDAESTYKSLKEQSSKSNFTMISKSAGIAASAQFGGRFDGPSRTRAKAAVSKYLMENYKDETDPVKLQKVADEFLKRDDWRDYQLGQRVEIIKESAKP